MALLGDAGVPFRVIPIAASTRESFTVNESRTAKQYRFVLPGPSLTVAGRSICRRTARCRRARLCEWPVAACRQVAGYRLLSAGCRHLPPIEHSADPALHLVAVAAHFVQGVFFSASVQGTARSASDPNC